MRGEVALAQREEEIALMYGKVPVEEFDNARRVLALSRKNFDNEDPTFREDYEFYGAADGAVTASYSGKCTKCGLELKFKDTHPISGWDS